MSDARLVPVWLVALALAAIAPAIVGGLQRLMERRRRQRTRDVIRAAGLTYDDDRPREF